MSMKSIGGFPLSDDYAVTRVPNAVLGRMLAEVEDADVIKLVLRAIWLLERQNGYPRVISVEQLKADRVLSVVFGDEGTFEGALEDAIDRDVLVRVSIDGVDRLMLNTESARRVLSGALGIAVDEDQNGESDGWDAPAVRSVGANAFRAYEENIGALSPMIRESILSSLEDFTDEEITQAIRIAVENESRSWSFVAGVLRRWAREGIPHERRDSRAGGGDRGRVSEDQLRRYLEEQRKRDRSRSA